MQKYFDLEDDTEKALQIKSAESCDNLKGYIYEEANKESYVRAAIGGLRVFNYYLILRLN